MPRTIAILCALPVLLTAVPSIAAVIFQAPGRDNIGEWDALQSWSPDGSASSSERISFVRSPLAGETRHVIRVELKPGDKAVNPRRSPPFPLGNRSELVRREQLGEGDERWYGWRVLFPRDFAVTDGKEGGAVFAQWHHIGPAGEPGSPPLLFAARADEIRLVSVPSLNSQEAVTLASVPQSRGRWRNFVVHIRFASDPKRSIIEWWLDGARVDVAPSPTLFPGYSAYLKMGLYRRPTAREDNVIFLDSIIEGTDHRDVLPLLRTVPAISGSSRR